MEKKFYSQVGQDKWVCDYFKYKKNGYFVDIGAYDGVELSNTYYLEKELNWSGICMEPSPIAFKKLKEQRNCILINKAAYHKNVQLKFVEDGLGGRIGNDSKYSYMVDAVRMDQVLEENNSPKIIDYISLDIEGGEYDALLAFPFNNYEVILWTIEHNLHAGMANLLLKANILNIMNKHGYQIVRENVGTSPLYPMEDWYINEKYL